MALRDRLWLWLCVALFSALSSLPKRTLSLGGVSQLLSPQELSGGGVWGGQSTGTYLFGRLSLAS